MAADPNTGAVMNGMDMRHILSTGLAAMPADANGIPFDMSHIYASGNLAGDMYCNVAAEATGRVLATRLYNATDDPGMKHMLPYSIARDTMHQQQWLAVLEELGPSHLPVPNSFPQSKEAQEWSYKFFIQTTDGQAGNQADQAWTNGTAPDGHGQFEPFIARPSKAQVSRISATDAQTRSGRKSRQTARAASMAQRGKEVIDHVK